MKNTLFMFVAFFTAALHGISSQGMTIGDYRIFAITETREEGKPFLIIRGVCISSAHVVKSVNVEVNAECAHVTVDSGLNISGDKSMTGGFVAKIELSEQITTVSFGPNRQTVWQRTRDQKKE